MRTRMRLSEVVVGILEAEYLRNPNWTSSEMYALADRTGLKKVKVYKWMWDRKKKESKLLRE